MPDDPERFVPHPALAKRSTREPIMCGIGGELVVIEYGDHRDAATEHIVEIIELFQDRSLVAISGLCLTHGEPMEFDLRKIQRVDELPSGGRYCSMLEWLLTYGVDMKLHSAGTNRFRYSWRGSIVNGVRRRQYD